MRILFLGNKDKELVNWLRTQGETVFFIKNKIEIDYVKSIMPELIISYGYKYKLPREIIKYPQRGTINLHISYLPYNRGTDPNIWSFLEDSPKGVTIHFIDERIDTGDILFQEQAKFNHKKETLKSTYAFLQTIIKNLFKKNWSKIKDGDFSAKKQGSKETAHFKKDRIRFKGLIEKKGWRTPIKELF